MTIAIEIVFSLNALKCSARRHPGVDRFEDMATVTVRDRFGIGALLPAP